MQDIDVDNACAPTAALCSHPLAVLFQVWHANLTKAPHTARAHLVQQALGIGGAFASGPLLLPQCLQMLHTLLHGCIPAGHQVSLHVRACVRVMWSIRQRALHLTLNKNNPPPSRLSLDKH